MNVKAVLTLIMMILTLKQKHARGVTVNANLDNTPDQCQNQEKRRPTQQWDIIEIDKKKGAKK